MKFNVWLGNMFLLKDMVFKYFNLTYILDFDGWAYGINLITGQEGMFPVSIALPPSGRNFKVTLINCVQNYEDIIGSNCFDGCALGISFNFYL